MPNVEFDPISSGPSSHTKVATSRSFVRGTTSSYIAHLAWYKSDAMRYFSIWSDALSSSVSERDTLLPLTWHLSSEQGNSVTWSSRTCLSCHKCLLASVRYWNKRRICCSSHVDPRGDHCYVPGKQCLLVIPRTLTVAPGIHVLAAHQRFSV